MKSTPVLKNFGALQRSNRATGGELVSVLLFLTLLIAACGWWLYRQNYILYYGDAQAHLDISRSIIDSKTPGYDQLGTVWLPLLHLICLPFVGNNWLWSSGLAGTVPVAFFYVAAGLFFYLAARETFSTRAAAIASLGCFALNPNILYLSAIPMTETLFLAGMALLLFAGSRFAEEERRSWLLLALVACWLMCLTRYDGWFLLPFAGVWIAYSSTRRVLTFAVFCALASVVPLLWFAHNWWQTANVLDFYNGPYSPGAIQGGKPYPGYQKLAEAVHYYFTAGRLCAGIALLLLGVLGTMCSFRSRAFVPILILLLTPLFYVISMYSSGGSPIYVPELWPHSYYNTRYGIAVVAFAAFAVGGLVAKIPPKLQRYSFVLPVLSILPWITSPTMDNVICWKESEVNSRLRRSWTEPAAEYLTAYYKTGQGITARFGDLTGIFCRAQIPLKEVLHEGNGPEWLATSTRPDLLHRNYWHISLGGRDNTAGEYRAVKLLPNLKEKTVQISQRVH